MVRRTLKQKEKISARRVNVVLGEAVKRDFGFTLNDIQVSRLEAKFQKKAEKSTTFDSRRLNLLDLARSLALALIILSLEVVLYWFQQRR